MRKPNNNPDQDGNSEPSANEFVTRSFLTRRWITSISTLKRMEKDPDPRQRLEAHRLTKRAVRYLMADVLRLERLGGSSE
jgi:hypothetical protein